MKFKKNIWKVINGSVLVVPILLMACHGMQTTVAPDNRITLRDGGPHTGTWESRTMLLDYEYFKQSDEIKLSLRLKIKTKARHDGYRVWVRFIDDQGKLLEEKSIWSWDNTLQIPPEAVYMSFRTFLPPHVYRPKIYR